MQISVNKNISSEFSPSTAAIAAITSAVCCDKYNKLSKKNSQQTLSSDAEKKLRAGAICFNFIKQKGKYKKYFYCFLGFSSFYVFRPKTLAFPVLDFFRNTKEESLAFFSNQKKNKGNSSHFWRPKKKYRQLWPKFISRLKIFTYV